VKGVPIRPGDIVLDIGANQGFFSCYAAHKGAKVFAFEPVPELRDRLMFNLRRNGFGARKVAIHLAKYANPKGTPYVADIANDNIKMALTYKVPQAWIKKAPKARTAKAPVSQVHV